MAEITTRFECPTCYSLHMIGRDASECCNTGCDPLLVYLCSCGARSFYRNAVYNCKCKEKKGVVHSQGDRE